MQQRPRENDNVVYGLNKWGLVKTHLPLVQARGLDPYLVVQHGQLVVPLHQLAKQNTLLADDGIVFFHLRKTTKRVITDVALSSYEDYLNGVVGIHP